ncbi:PorT family protein [Flavobacteriaceae bacterium F08102]|nr:PorT family protein [Flavobacteriaceae bacterium F08102]
MKNFIIYITVLVVMSVCHRVYAQHDVSSILEQLKSEKERISEDEKALLKKEVLTINKQLENKEITVQEAQDKKTEAAKRHALNIQNRHAIIDHQIALLNRNKELHFDYGLRPSSTSNFSIRGVGKLNSEDRNTSKNDVRTYDELILAFGLNNAVIDGESLNDTPYKVGGSKFFEIGWAWRTRVFKNSNVLRFHYGFSFQFNGLKAKDNNYFVDNDGQTELAEFEYNLKKAKLRMDNLVIPIHIEFGPSNKTQTGDRIRYSLQRKFRVGLGGYAGVNLGSRQKLKYKIDGDAVKDKLKRDYNTGSFVYGLSAYMGIGSTLLYAKYDLNPLFKDAEIEQHNVSLGLRFDL